MATKLQLVTAMYDHKLNELMDSAAKWQEFLCSASRNYKLAFEEQVLIYAQRPDATAVLEIEKWNNAFGRWVNRGATGIAVIDRDYLGKRRLRYYFDISDTRDSHRSRPVPIWNMKPEYEADVIETLEASFGELVDKKTLAQAIVSAANNAVADNITDYLKDLCDCREGSFLEELDELNVEVLYTNTLKNSVAFMLLTRCGLNPTDDFEPEDFQGIYHFNTPDTAILLGTATSAIAEMGLREIASTVWNLQKSRWSAIHTFADGRGIGDHNTVSKAGRSFGHERTDLQQGERLSDPRPDSAQGTRSGAWQVRTATPPLSDKSPQGIVQPSADERRTEPAPDGSRTDGTGAHGLDGITNGSTAGRDRRTESARSDGMGGQDEQYPAERGRSDSGRTDLQLALFPSPEEQMARIEEAEGVATKPPASSISTELLPEGKYPRKSAREDEHRQQPVEEHADAEILHRESTTGTTGSRHEYHLGDSVYIGTHEYEVLAFDDSTVRLYDTQFPIINIEMPRTEFDHKIAENPLNAHLCVATQPSMPAPAAETPLEGLSIRPDSEEVEYTPVRGERYEIDKRLFEVESVGDRSVELRDITFQQDVGFPIFRRESLDFIRCFKPLNFEQRPKAGKATTEPPAPELQAIEPELLTPVWEQKKRPSRVDYFDAFQGVPMFERRNFHIVDDNLGHGGAKAKFRANMEAINLLHDLELDRRLATSEEQEILSHYVGWGSLQDAFKEHNPGWEKEFVELYTALSPEEYASARATTLNAHYTSPTVIKAIYKAIANMGFTSGNILDPGCGTGNFQGLLPDSMSDSKIFGIEIDSLTGRIAQQLYQRNSIAIQGYEDTALPDSFFDLAVGNVPFGSYSVNDKKFDKYKLLIHDYFFAKTLDKVRPGGVIAFITSKGTLDKQNPAVRKYIAQRAELLGAIRLPNNAFLANAGTKVTTDIIFLQKRDHVVDIEPDWVYLSTTEDGIPINAYFAEHPEMMLGTMARDDMMYGNSNETTLNPYPDRALADLLDEAVTNIHAEIADFDRFDTEPGEDNSIPADPTVRNFSFTVVDSQIYYRENSRMNPKELSVTAQSRVKGLIEIRECVRRLITYQTEDYPDSDIQTEQATLNRLYDNYTSKYDIINARANNVAFSDDESYPLLCSLEVLDENLKFKAKADMFSKRTINPYRPITHVDTASEALAVSISEKARVDLDFMSEITGMDRDALIKELEGIIFLNISSVSSQEKSYVTADEYLSGNVREKLEQARTAQAAIGDGSLDHNVQALEAVQPKDLTAPEISVRLGATWIPPEIYQKFIYDLLDIGWRKQERIRVLYSSHTAEWNITEKSADRGNVKSFSTYGTRRMNAYQIIEQTLNLRTVRVFDTVIDADGSEKRVLNKRETAIAQDKQDVIKMQFAEWVWRDPNRREMLCKLYNSRFNSIRPRQYDGRHIKFHGMNPEIRLDPHQMNAVARYLYGGNALFGHAVGAGKSFEMIAAGMEAKHLGLCHKAMFVVPNNIIVDFASDFFKLYPSANVLMTTAKDFEKKNRKRFCARIATGDYDGVIIAHSQFEKIPMSKERQQLSLKQQILDIQIGIDDLKQRNGERFTIKQMEKARKSLQVKLNKLNDQSRKDSLITFEELGVDMLVVDEADMFKNLYLATKMRNVGGVSQTESQKASDLFMKTRYLDEITGNRGTVFATGTPISNTLAEVYTMQRYLQYDALSRQGLQHFDCWASTFGETVTAMELTPEGSGFQMKTRFSNFYNLPELMSMFKEVADIQTKDMLNLPTPKVKAHTVVTKPSEIQQEMIAELAERAERIRRREVDASKDNMLLITNDGRKIALDQRIINPMLPDHPESKVNACVDNVFQIWKETGGKRLTQLIFSDLSTPKGNEQRDAVSDSDLPPLFTSVYGDIKAKLMAKGIPAEEIAFIHDAKNETQKKEIVAKVRSGKIRVLLGSTFKMGAGMNAQDLLYANHNLDCPWRPRDLEQRSGRIERRGNSNPEVHIYCYVTEGTFDAYCYQIIENKQRAISQVFTSRSPARIMQEIDDVALNYAEIKALATGNPLIIERCSLEAEVNKLKTLKSSHLSQRYELEDKISKTYPAEIKQLTERIAGYQHDIAVVAAHPKPSGDAFVGMTIGGQLLIDKKEAGTAILKACKAMTKPDAAPLGEYRGFAMSLSFDTFGKEYRITLDGQLTHMVSLGTDIHGNITRLDNALNDMTPKLTICREQLEAVNAQLETAKMEVQVPFPREQELADKTTRLAELTIELKMNEKDHEILDDAPDEGDETAQPQRKNRERGNAR
jgi:N12 class adenine-specific DNA methylase